MARASATAIALALAASGSGGEARVRPWTRGAAPALGSSALDGRPFHLRSLRGRVVLVHFWATWCEPCVDELPSLSRLRETLRDRPFELVMVNFGEGKARVERFAREHALAPPIVLDRNREAADAWRVAELPMSFLVDAGGRVRTVVHGQCDWTSGEPAAALERLLAKAERHRRDARAGPRDGARASDGGGEPHGMRARP